MIPLPYRILAAILAMACAVFFGYEKGISHEKAKWQAAESARVLAEHDALIKRNADNSRLAAEQAATNAAIIKGKNDEITRLTARVEHLGRLRVGASVCGGTSIAPETTSTGSGNDADPLGRLVSEQADRDFKSLILDVEKDLATGRACQAFVRDNGLAP